jgi:outer membrane protein TolC
MTSDIRYRLTRRRARAAILALKLAFCSVTLAAGQYPAASAGVPLFTGGRIKGDITQAEAELRQRKAEAQNIRGQIDHDVRTAFLDLNAAKEQVTVAKQNVELANESLARSKDRFTSGVTDSVEVVQAEQALASANDQCITSLYNHNFAKLSLARALGVARTDYKQYLGGK